MSGPEPQNGGEKSREDLRRMVKAARAQAGSSSVARTWSVVPPDSIPGYEIVREIHRGAQGVVYQAIQKTTKRKVAVKVMREGPFASTRERKRFEREVEILGQLNHPNIVSIIDSGEASGCFYYVMDYVPGQALDQFMSAAPRTVDETLALFGKICEVVNSAHLRGVIHRDLKPGNIRVDPDGQPHVLDFGLAKIVGSEITGVSHPEVMTMTGQFIGSLPWASPEQAEGVPEKIDVRTDVYSLGVILYQMLTGGKFPYQVIGAMRDVLDNILRALPERPSSVRRQINDEVETIVLKALSKERDRRYQNAGDLGRDIHRYLHGEPIEAKRDSGLYILRKMAGRHKRSAGVAMAFLLLIIGFGIVMSVLYAKAKAEEARANENFQAVRSLANTFMFDFADRIEPLRGATPARMKLLEEAQKYLEKIRMQAADDSALARDLARAYDRVGELQGGLHLPKLGTVPQAAESFAKARTIREQLLAANPDDPQSHVDMAESLVRTGDMTFDTLKFAEARDRYAEAVAALDRAIAKVPRDDRRLEGWRDQRARAIRQRADALMEFARSGDENQIDEGARLIDESTGFYDQALAYWRDRAAHDGGSLEVAKHLGRTMEHRTQAALVKAEIDRRRAGTAAGRGEVAAAIASLGRALSHSREAEKEALQAAEEFETLSREHPQNAVLRRDTYLSYHNAGTARQIAAGLRDELAVIEKARANEHRAAARDDRLVALELFIKALAITTGLSAADESNLSARRDMAICLNKIGNQLRDLDRLDEAQRAFERSLELRRELIKTDPMQGHQQDLAVATFKLGEIAEKRAEKSPVEVRRSMLDAAQKMYSESLGLYESLAKEGVVAESRQPRIVRTALERVRKGLGSEGG